MEERKVGGSVEINITGQSIKMMTYYMFLNIVVTNIEISRRKCKYIREAGGV